MTDPERWRQEQDGRIATLPHRRVLALLGPPDGAAHRIMVESLRLDQLTRGLDPETAKMRITIEAWNRRRREGGSAGP